MKLFFATVILVLHGVAAKDCCPFPAAGLSIITDIDMFDYMLKCSDSVKITCKPTKIMGESVEIGVAGNVTGGATVEESQVLSKSTSSPISFTATCDKATKLWSKDGSGAFTKFACVKKIGSYWINM